MANNVIKFLRQKDYTFIREIGQGGLGKTVLLKDDVIGEQFVCKKYEPAYENHKQTFFNNFVQEIKLLHFLHHKNLVRIFNYYLYPNHLTGYILMEHIDGVNIETYAQDNPDKVNNIFTQVIEGFRYLEEINILHRDIRPQNILVSNDGIVKIIDFGFGKKIDFPGDFGKSITINWRYSIPDEFSEQIYDFRTEIYFVAKLFEEIISQNSIGEFAYKDLLEKMTENYNNRINSFFEVSTKITEGSSLYHQFTHFDREIYKTFATSLTSIFSKILHGTNYVTDVDRIIQELDDIFQSSVLEDYIQNASQLSECFIKGGYTYYKDRKIEVTTVGNFITLMKGLSKEKQKVVLTHLWNRLDNIERESNDDELPF